MPVLLPPRLLPLPARAHRLEPLPMATRPLPQAASLLTSTLLPLLPALEPSDLLVLPLPLPLPPAAPFARPTG